MNAVFTMRGINDELQVFEDRLTITPKGVMGFISKGAKGAKTIPFTSITAVQHKKAGLLSGYLQFTIPGGNESKRGVWAAASDENTFMYRNSSDNGRVEEIKSYIETQVMALRPANPQQVSASDEISKLADLKARGILTDEEFQKAKAKLLGI